MGHEGTERFLRVKHASLGHPKFLGLTAAERGTWLVACLLADIAHPGEVHEAAVLEKCPDAAFQRLYERELLEQGSRVGWFRVHDLKQEGHVAPSQTPEAIRARVAKHRASHSVTPVTGVTDVTTDETRLDETRVTTSSRVGLVGPREPVAAIEGGRPGRRGLQRAVEAS